MTKQLFRNLDWVFALPVLLLTAFWPDMADAQNLTIGDNENYIRLFGQFDKAFLSYDDGRSRRLYPLIDNDSSSSRIGIRGQIQNDDGTTFGATLEIRWTPYSTKNTNQTTNTIELGSTSIRKAELHAASPHYGKFWVGRGRMASDSTSETDLSGTQLAAYASVADIAAAQLFRLSEGDLSSIAVDAAFSDLDGLGKQVRVRFDTPDFHGFTIGTSVDIARNWDIALMYRRNLGDFTLASSAAYSKGAIVDGDLINGSASVLHDPSGISLTVAAGRNWRKTRTREFVYGKIGYQADWIQIGRTYLSVDAYLGSDINSIGSRSRAYGFAVVQAMDSWDTDFYFGLRSYRFEAPAQTYLDGHAAIVGARVKF